MDFAKTYLNPLRRLSPFYIFLIAVLPIFISILIHTFALISASLITWSFAAAKDIEQDISTTIVLNGRKDDGLRFQGTDLLDSFNAEDHLYYPVPEIEYRQVIPEMEIFPESKVNDDMDIISVQAAALDHKWVNPSTGGQPLYTGPERLVGSFSRHLQALREGGLDVVFVFDSTSSMSSYLGKVKLKINNLAQAFRKLVPACRIGLVTYRDHEDEYVTRSYPLTYGTLSLHDFLIEIDAVGGHDIREAVGEGLKVAINGMKWNKKSKKFILLIGDAPPHVEEIERDMAMIRKFRDEMDGRLSALDIRKPIKMSFTYWNTAIRPFITDPQLGSYEYRTDSQDVIDEFQTFADIGGGESARLINEEKVVKQMLLLNFGTRWEMYLDEFMKNL